MSKQFVAIATLLAWQAADTEMKEGGLFFNEDQLNALEKAVAEGATASIALGANAKTVADLQAANADLKKANDVQAATILSQTTEITKLKGESSGKGSTVATTADDLHETDDKPTAPAGILIYN